MVRDAQFVHARASEPSAVNQAIVAGKPFIPNVHFAVALPEITFSMITVGGYLRKLRVELLQANMRGEIER